MPPLTSSLRNQLERAIIQARDAAEAAAIAALGSLGVWQDAAHASLPLNERGLRVALRARARAVGATVTDPTSLVREVAYEGWHRMLFARFLAENGLLRHPEGIAVTLDDCAELAADEGEPDAWMLAARYAGAMLPGIFKSDDPAAQVRFAPEGRAALEGILTGLPAAIFTADDGLGWVYQFWQSRAKEEVNKSGRKIGGADLSAVTQLFTEDYMVRFLLENSLGAWWAARHPDSPLLKQFTYLRFKDDGTPAAGAFPGWPERAAEVTVMDPCCGSGHFLVAAFTMLRQMRMEEEGLAEADAADAVLRDNLFGLEIDARCTQIAAFALALVAWKAGGYRELPLPNIACSGIPVQGQWETWSKLAGDDSRLRSALGELYRLFTQAPDLGSLIDPTTIATHDPMFTANFVEVAPLLQQALEREQKNGDPTAAVFGASAAGVVRASQMLARMYTLVATNVPFLTSGKQSDELKTFCQTRYPNAKLDLATVFLARCRTFSGRGCSYSVVTPQNWLFLRSYQRLRQVLIEEQHLRLLVRIGEKGFESSAAAGAFTALVIISNERSQVRDTYAAVDVADADSVLGKRELLRIGPLSHMDQLRQLENHGSNIVFRAIVLGEPLSKYVSVHYGSKPGQTSMTTKYFWELQTIDKRYWMFMESSPDGSHVYTGKSELCMSLEMITRHKVSEFGLRGRDAWGRRGVILSQMRDLPTSLYLGKFFDNNTSVIIPRDDTNLPAVFHFMFSGEYSKLVRSKNHKLDVDTGSMVNVPFDLTYWQAVAGAAGPLPEPYSNDPTQWLFKGHPADATEPLQVAVARLLGYHWPQQEEDALDASADDDGIVCIPPLAGEQPAAEQLRALLATAFGAGWSNAQQTNLLAAVGFAGKGLESWLRDGFFPQHCKIFHNRPFIWQIWDGTRNGFSALVNYHKLDRALLDKLIYTYLGSWIETQRHARDANEAGAEDRLVKALALQKQLIAIREGEPPLDIYVRWKPLAQQPIGWNPDLNDGVRLNIRPFVTAGVLRSTFTINWNKDRGIDPDGSERHNDRHHTVQEKQAARQLAAR